MAALICVAAPIVAIGVICWVHSQFGDELFGLEWPVSELNRKDDYRLIKLPLNRQRRNPSIDRNRPL